jgi:hypothetical protein
MSTSTYFRPNIHKNGPEILGVNLYPKKNLAWGETSYLTVENMHSDEWLMLMHRKTKKAQKVTE